MPKVFISYRRDDSADVTGRIYDRLVAKLGGKNVFIDVDAIPLGADFRKRIHNEVSRCDVLLAVIGIEWLDLREGEGNRRIDNPADFVRIEIEAALQRHIPVIPLLVRGASMPREGQLPASLHELAFRNGIPIRPDPDFHSDVDRLIRALRKLPAQAPSRAGSSLPPGAPVAPVMPLFREVVNSIGMKMVLIPAGQFLMGSPDSGEQALKCERPQHRVQITKPFYLGIYPVTQEQYERVIGQNPSQFKGDPQRPVECVSWEDAVKFCRRLSALEKTATDVYRLPTEAQWEYACRAGTTTKWCFGDSASLLPEYAWYSGNSEDTAHAVGQKKPNARGLYDMHGNVWEWCADWYAEDYYRSSPLDDPTGPDFGDYRVLRGGSWGNGPASARSAIRLRYVPAGRGQLLGFRVARTL